MNPTPQAFHIVYPKKGQNTYELSTFIMGQVLLNPKQCQLFIQDKLTPLSEHGFFTEPVILVPGDNYIAIELKMHEGTYTESRHIISEYPEKIPNIEFPEVNLNTLTKTGPIARMAGNEFSFALSASPNATVWLDIPNVLSKPIKIKPLYPSAKTEKDGYIDNREPVFKELHQTKRRIPKAGWHEATITIPQDTSPIENTPIKLTLETPQTSQTFTLPLTLSIWAKPKLALVQTLNADGATTRNDLPEGDRLTPLQSGALLWIDGQENDWYRIQLSLQDHAWIHQNDIIFQADNTPHPMQIEPPYVLTHDITTHTESITIHCNTALPIHIAASPSKITANLYGGTLGQCTQPNQNDYFQSLTVSQTRENVVTLEAKLAKPCAGFDIVNQLNGDMQLKIKSLPKQLSDLIIVLDPGHGGSEMGAIGLSDLPEKTLNLTMAQMLQLELQASGIPNVILTRTIDQELPLPERGAFVRNHQPHLVISIHHNALPDGRNPKKYKGACTFYYHPFSKPFAESLQHALVNEAKMPNFGTGVFHESFYMTRIPQAISVLVELGFFTYPEEYELLIDPVHQKKTVVALTKAIHKFFIAQLSLTGND